MFAGSLLVRISGALAVPAQWGLPFRIDEPDVSLTDYGLAVETTIFAAVLAWQVTSWPRLRWWSVAFFGAATMASLAGGTDHGFLRRDGRETAHDVVWAATLLAIGVSSLALVAIGAEIGLSRVAARRLVAAGTVALAAYALVVLVAWRDFLVAILIYAPAALFLLAVFVLRYRRLQSRASLLGAAAVLLAFVAAAVQQGEISIDAISLNHNALYHLIQAISFALLFLAIRGLLSNEGASEARRIPETTHW
jgi:hypothetical protein